MRIISGSAKGRLLSSPSGKKIRLTSDKVKKALFDILQGEVEGVELLELFAGSGNIGIESLSRGAKTVVFADHDNRCIKTIRKNLERSGCGDSAETVTLLRIDAFRAITLLYKQKRKFDTIFLDPPYCRGLVKKTLINLARYDILKHSGVIIAEHSRRDILLPDIEGLKLTQQRKYGDTILSFYKRS